MMPLENNHKTFREFISQPELIYALHVGVFSALAVLINTVGVKLFSFGALTLPVSVFFLPLTFLMTDIVSEVYGEKHALLMVVSGFCMNLLMLLFIMLGVSLPTSPLYPIGEAYHQVFQPAWRLFFASMCAYLLAQALDVRLFHYCKTLTRGKHLWLRNNVSTGVSQLVDSMTVNFIFLYNNPSVFQGDFYDVLSITIQIYVVKLLFAIVDTPFCYVGVWALKSLIHRARKQNDVALILEQQTGEKHIEATI